MQAAPSGITIPADYTPVSSEAEFDEIYQGIRAKPSGNLEKIFLHINGWKPTKTYYLEGDLSILGSGTTTIDGSHFNKFGYFIGNTIYDWENHLKDENGDSILKYSNHFSLSNMDIINFGNDTSSIIDLSSVQDAKLDNVRLIRNSIHSGLGAVTIDGEGCDYTCKITINNSFFSRNRTSYFGKNKDLSFGVLALFGDVKGNISNTTFIDNVTAGSSSAIDVYNSDINIKNVSFINNTSTPARDDESEIANISGGALKLVNTSTRIENSLFIDNTVTHENSIKDNNEIGIKSGAVSIYNKDASLRSNIFLKNTAHSVSHNVYGGAIGFLLPKDEDNPYAHGHTIYLTGGNLFIGNRAQSISKMGYGGAIYLTGDIWDLRISSYGEKMIFYGNQFGKKDELQYNSIYMDTSDRDDNGYITIYENDFVSKDEKILIFDPIYWKNEGNIDHGIYFSKYTGTGGKSDRRGVYLGGNNVFDGNVNIRDAYINLTTVDYGNGITTNASVIANSKDSNIYKLYVRGSGLVQAQTIYLGSAQATSITNTGILASDIHSKTPIEDLYNIDVKESASSDSQITLVGNVIAGKYFVDASAEEHGKIVIDGTLSRDTNNSYGQVVVTATDDTPQPTKRVTVLSLKSAPSNLRLEKEVIGNIIYGANIIAKGENYLDIDAKLIRNGNNIDVQYTYNGLIWNSNKFDEFGNYFANGDFSILAERIFTVNTSLHDRFNGNDLNKSGYGTLVLNADNTYTGKTTVRNGTVVIGESSNHLNARVAGDVFVHTDAAISGYGSIGGDLKIQGKNSVYHEAGGYIVSINPDGTSSKLTVDGKVHIGYENNKLANSNLFVSHGTGAGTWQDVTTYTILEAKGGIEGTFSEIKNSLSFLKPTIVYHANEIELIMERIGVGDPNKWNLNWSDDENNVILGASANQVAIRRGIIALPTEHPVVQATIDMVDDEQIKDAMDNLSGEVYSSSLESQMKSSINNNSYVDLNLLNSWRSPSSAKNQFANLSNKFGLGGTKSSYDANMWVNTWSTQSQIKGDANAAKASISNTGMVLGLDTLLDNEVTLGALAGYEIGRVKVSNTRSSELNTSSAILGGYALTGMGDFDISAGLTYVQMDYDSERSINVGAINDQAKADYKGNKIQAVIEGSKLIDVGDNFAVAPYINLAHHIIHTDKISEDNSQAALEVAAQTNNVSQLTAGSRVAYKLDSGVPVTFTANAGYQMRFGDTNPTTTHSFKGTDTRFEVQGATVNQNRLTLGVGVEAQFTPKSKLVALYNNEDKSATLSLGMRF